MLLKQIKSAVEDHQSKVVGLSIVNISTTGYREERWRWCVLSALAYQNNNKKRSSQTVIVNYWNNPFWCLSRTRKFLTVIQCSRKKLHQNNGLRSYMASNDIDKNYIATNYNRFFWATRFVFSFSLFFVSVPCASVKILWPCACWKFGRGLGDWPAIRIREHSSRGGRSAKNEWLDWRRSIGQLTPDVTTDRMSMRPTNAFHYYWNPLTDRSPRDLLFCRRQWLLTQQEGPMSFVRLTSRPSTYAAWRRTKPAFLGDRRIRAMETTGAARSS